MELLIDIERVEQLVNLFGNLDENIKKIENRYNVAITSHAGQLKIIGETINVSNASRAIKCLLEIINKGEALTAHNIDYVMNMVEEDEDDKIERPSPIIEYLFSTRLTPKSAAHSDTRMPAMKAYFTKSN